ncbi:MAG: hypothetical protein WBD20_02800 [Pirellulaceae bacterium]
MRKFATTGALCAIVMTASMASAKDDFSALLSELSYNQSSVPSYKIAQSPTAPAAAETLGTAAANAAPQAAISMPAVTQHAPQIQQNYNVGPAPVSFQQGCDVAGGSCDSGTCGASGYGNGSCGSGGCLAGGCRSGNCGEGGYCTPHNQPNLPGSTLRQYWRSNACNSNVWDGYQNQCRKPLFGSKDRGCGIGGCSTAGCQGECASGACATLPSQAVYGAAGGCDTPNFNTPAATSCDSGNCDTKGWSF